MAAEPDSEIQVDPDSTRAINPAMRRRLQECYERGRAMAEKDPPDHDYATTMFSQCILNDPGNGVYVEAFLTNLERKYDNNKKGARIKGFGGRGNFKKAMAAENWKDILRFGADLLKSNPWDVPALRGMAQACEALAYNESELRYLKNALAAKPKDADVNRHCGNSLARMGQFDQAIACFHRIEEYKKSDEEATKMVSRLTEDKARVAQGLPPKWVPQPRGRAQPGMPRGARSADGSLPTVVVDVTDERQQELEKKIADKPEVIENYTELANLLGDQDQFAEAEKVLTDALAASGNDLKIREALEDMQLRRSRHQVSIAEKRAAEEQTEEAADLVKRMRQDSYRLETDILGSRNERYPGDKEIVLKLAVSLKRIGNYQEATRHLRIVREDPAFKVQATLELGECLQHQKKFAKSLQCYTRAAELADKGSEARKMALYRAGVLAMGMKEGEKAEKFLKDLISMDPQFKDAQARLDKVRRIRDKD